MQAPAARSQSYGSSGSYTLPPGSVVDDGNIHVAPLPGTPEARPGSALEMASIAGTVLPGDFMLVSAQSNRFGPYPYRQDAAVGSERFPYTLQVDSDQSFRLLDPRKHAMLGPFRYETGTTIPFEQATLSVLRLPSQVIVALPTYGKQPRAPTLAMAPLTPAMVKSLSELRANLATVYNRLSGEIATRGMEGVPVVKDAFGVVRDNTVKASLRDRENARHRAESTAGLLLERFQRDGMPLQPSPAGGLTCAFPSVPPGQYVLGMIWWLQSKEGVNVTTSTLEVWWTTLQIGPHEKIVYALTPENACGWAGIFRFPKFD
jgi:hypothetical protein